METVVTKLSNITNPGIVRIDLFGRNKNFVKITCSDTFEKVKILKAAKTCKPAGVFFFEFLTALRNKLFFDLRELKRGNPERILSAYTISGNIYCKLNNSNNYFRIRQQKDLNEIKKRL